MADLQLTRYEAQAQQLPGVCMQCSEPATEVMDRSYTTDKVDLIPPAEPVGCLVLFPIIALLKVFSASTAKTMTVRTPLCHKHARSWLAWNKLDARAITDDTILLSGVSEAYAEAWAKQKPASEIGGASGAVQREVVKVRCRSCQALNHEGAKFCDQCGAEM